MTAYVRVIARKGQVTLPDHLVSINFLSLINPLLFNTQLIIS